MKVEIVMNSGEKYCVEGDFYSVSERFKNDLGIVINDFTEIKPGIFINPSNISSLKEIRE